MASPGVSVAAYSIICNKSGVIRRSIIGRSFIDW